MPGTMFTEMVSPHSDSTGKWYTLPLSFVIHTAILAVAIAVPLIATDVLPSPPRTLLAYMMVEVPNVPPPAAPAKRTSPPTAQVNSDAAPLEAPQGVRVESGVIADHEPIGTDTLDNIFHGVGIPGVTIEQPPIAAPLPEPVRPGGIIKPPTRIRDVKPIYPYLARAAKVEGIVIIEAMIGVGGQVENARVIRSVPLLDEAALAAVRLWEYTPTLLNGRATPVIMTVTVQFKLN